MSTVTTEQIDLAVPNVATDETTYEAGQLRRDGMNAALKALRTDVVALEQSVEDLSTSGIAGPQGPQGLTGATGATLQAFSKPAGVPGQTRTAVGASLGQSGGQVMFSIGPGAPLGAHRVAVQIGTVGGRSKSCVMLIKVDA